jgi:hypothetical protein
MFEHRFTGALSKNGHRQRQTGRERALPKPEVEGVRVYWLTPADRARKRR